MRQIGVALANSIYKSFAQLGEGTDTEGLGPLKWSVDHRLLAGWGDDTDVLQASGSYGLSSHLVAEWAGAFLGDAAAAETELPMDERRILLLAEGAGEEEVRAQLASWRAQLLTEVPDSTGAGTDRLYALWRASGGADNPGQAWATALSALVRHPLAVAR